MLICSVLYLLAVEMEVGQAAAVVVWSEALILSNPLLVCQGYLQSGPEWSKTRLRWGLLPEPRWVSLQRSPDPLPCSRPRILVLQASCFELWRM